MTMGEIKETSALERHLALLRQPAPPGVTQEQHEANLRVLNSEFLRDIGRAAGEKAAREYFRHLQADGPVLGVAIWRHTMFDALAKLDAGMSSVSAEGRAIVLDGHREALEEALKRGSAPEVPERNRKHKHSLRIVHDTH